MRSCDRVMATINLSRPDRAPVIHSPLPGALIKYGERLNAIFAKYPQDFGPSEFAIPKLPSFRLITEKAFIKMNGEPFGFHQLMVFMDRFMITY